MYGSLPLNYLLLIQYKLASNKYLWITMNVEHFFFSDRHTKVNMALTMSSKPLFQSDESEGEGEAVSDDDFQNTSVRQPRAPPRVAVKPSASHGKAKVSQVSNTSHMRSGGQ